MFTPADVDTNVELHSLDRMNPDLSMVGMIRCRLPHRKWIFHAKCHYWTTNSTIHTYLLICYSCMARLYGNVCI